jgi:hypothetical protein
MSDMLRDMVVVVIHDGTLLVIFTLILRKKLHPQRGLKNILHLISAFVNNTNFLLISFDDLSENRTILSCVDSNMVYFIALHKIIMRHLIKL